MLFAVEGSQAGTRKNSPQVVVLFQETSPLEPPGVIHRIIHPKQEFFHQYFLPHRNVPSRQEIDTREPFRGSLFCAPSKISPGKNNLWTGPVQEMPATEGLDGLRIGQSF